MDPSGKEALLGMTLDGLREAAAAAGLPAYGAKQVADWLYRKHAPDIAAMTNLSAKARAALAERYEVGAVPPSRVQESADGTKKYLYPTRPGRFVETAWIPEPDRSTLCVSTQVGCKMGCLFCMTAKQGFQGHLTAGEIFNQYGSLPERDRVTNLVYMGMGEPMDNLDAVLASLAILTSPWGCAMSPRRITVSTIGLVPAVRRFLAESQCHLAVSLHSPFEEERRRLMPIEHVHPLPELIAALRAHDFGLQRRLSFEYILFKDLNDTPRHVRELARLLNGLRCRINLMRFHPIPGVPLEGSGEAAVAAFQEGLNAKGILATVRRSRGLDIAAACGLLSTRALQPGEPVEY
ncbi:MAG: 23S rRNA (adenine(2503)-C(2))-methyltransferase RlmN [Verrucomicrobia bacterium]|nr:23S rRNA (adenine(2503)-C(2))-methyltransferase RlmN [Verrucomicrobiota bacterium]